MEYVKMKQKEMKQCVKLSTKAFFNYDYFSFFIDKFHRPSDTIDFEYCV